MKKTFYQEALDAYANPYHEFITEPITGGLINHSYKVTSKLSNEIFLLQQINKHVFPNPAQVQGNYEMLWRFLQTEEIPFVIPAPKFFPDQSALFCDSNGQYWRVFEFISGTETAETATTTSQAKAVAQSFGSFTASFKDFNPSQLNATIPGFHDLSFRFRQFRQSIRSVHYERLVKAARLVDELKSREHYVSFYEILVESPEFPQRVMHHDAKISNVLFDVETGKVICPVDLDTVMPGYFFSDLGDMIRSMACCKDENSIEFNDLCIRPDFYEAIHEGYLSVMDKQLTPSEKKYIHFTGIVMIYMQALRFLSDYLNGDTYYRIDYKEQNYDRALNQATLLQELEKFLLTNYQFKV